MTQKRVAPDRLRLLVNPLQKTSPAFGDMPRKKTLRPDGLRLLVNPLQKNPPAFGDVPRKNVETRPPSAFGQSPAKSPASLRKCISKKYSGQTVFGFWSIPCKKPLQPSEIYPGKMFTPVRFRLPFHTDREAPQVACCGDLKKYGSRQLPAFGQYPAENHSRSPMRCLEKEQLQTTFGFWSMFCKNPCQRSEMYPGKMFTPVRLRLPFPTDREAPQVGRCDDSKKCNSRQPSAFCQSPAKSPASLRRCDPKKRSRQIAFGFWSILRERYLQPSEMCPEKTFRPDNLRLLVNPFRKISPVARCDDSKRSSSRQPSAFGHSSTKSLSSLRRCTPEKCLRQTASSFWSIPCKKSRQPSEIYPEKMLKPDGLRLLVDPLRKALPAFGDIPQKNVHAR